MKRLGPDKSVAMSDRHREKVPQTQPATAGGPPRPPKKTAKDLAGDSPQERHIDIPDPVVIRDLATALEQKPFRIIADLMEMGRFATVHQVLAFEIASG